MTYTVKDRLGEIDWGKLQPGDTVQIPYKAGGYHERIVLGRRGTADAWILIVGLPGPNGELPIIDGTDAATDPQFALTYPPVEVNGLVTVWKTAATGSVVPGFIEIKNLEVRSAKAGNSFTGADGTKKQWSSASGIYALMFDHLKVTNCVVTDCDQGIFTGDSQPCSDITLTGNTITGNGVVGSDQLHGTYVQSAGATYLNNRYGPMRPGSGGGALKDRSADVLIQGNVITAGARCIDVGAWMNEVALRQQRPNATRTQILNNTLIDPANSVTLVYVEGRTLPDGTADQITFQNNTVVVRADATKFAYVQWFRSEYAPQAQIQASGNLLDVAPATAGGTPPEFRVFDSVGTLALGANWSRNPASDYPQQWPHPNCTLNGFGNIKVGSAAPGYTNESAGDYSLVPGAAATGFGATAAPLPPAPAPAPDPTPVPTPTPTPPAPGPLSIVKTERVLRVALSDGTTLYTPEP